MTFVAATFPISRSLDIDIGRQDGGAALNGGGGGSSVFLPVRGNRHNVHGGTFRCGGRTSPSKRIAKSLNDEHS